MAEQQRSLVKKLAKVMSEVKYIQKRGYNQFHKYSYATESDVSDKVREVLAEQNVMMIPSVTDLQSREHQNRRGAVEYIATVTMEFTFIDGDSGEEIKFTVPGEGQDAGDKAVYKAMTGAQKYALMKAFMIPTGDDPEADSAVDERNHQQKPPQQQQRQQRPPQQRQQKPPQAPPKQDGGGITAEQVKELSGVVQEASEKSGIDQAQVFADAAKACGFPGKTSKQLTSQEGDKVIKYLRGLIA
ncbi:ERF family protein [Bhargavaea ginsengi]|uniref:ERF family protein n=1 Tax=Bhargavaea ginsengi TaxID=426757 RepID=UPI003C78E8ED